MSKVFTGFLILVFSAFLWLVPISPLIYTFRTDITTDEFFTETAVATTNATVTLSKYVYDDDSSTISFLSSRNTDIPVLVSYNATTRATLVTGLTANATRTLDVSYDTDALDSDAWDTVLDLFSKVWMILIICFPIVGLAVILIDKFVSKKGA